MKPQKQLLTVLFTATAILNLPPFGSPPAGWRGTEGGLFAQDIHFSQFEQTPLLINPALAGTFGGTHRVILNYKDQWKAFGSPYKTYALSYDFLFLKKKWEKAKLAGGLFIFTDKAGYSNLSSTQIDLSVSSIVRLNDHQSVSAGLQGGFAQKSVDFSEVSTDNQFDNGAYDPNIPVGETNNFNKRSYSDFTTGILWSYVKDDKNPFANNQLKANAGAALYHVNRPKQEFYELNSNRLYAKVSLHGSGYIGLNSRFALKPSFLFLNQGPTSEFDVGAMVRYRIKEGGLYKGLPQEAAFFLGGYYRAGDAFIPAFSLEIANFSFGVSYDINTSDLKIATKGQGGIEISLRYINPNPFKRDKSSSLM